MAWYLGTRGFELQKDWISVLALVSLVTQMVKKNLPAAWETHV